jgi:glycogen(starch) synthase
VSLPVHVLHVLDHSWPVLDGYSQRSRSLISAQKQLGFSPTVVTSPLHNQDEPGAVEVDLDGVHYSRVAENAGLTWSAIRRRWPFLREAAVVRLLEKRVGELLRSGEFDLVHAHSPALCGLAAARAVRAQRLPFVYEVRSFWEESPNGEAHRQGLAIRYRLARMLESYVVARADAIVCIAQPMQHELISRGASAEKIFLVPNGVDSSRFAPRERDATLACELGVEDFPTLGFLGTLFPWEGVAWLVHAAAVLRAHGTRFKLLIAGAGEEENAIRHAIQKEDASGFVSYLGRIPHQDVERYYSVMDVLVYPRHSMRLTELVTPLKPLEAMAQGKAILGSDVGGIRELLVPGECGLLFRAGSVDDFCAQAARLLADKELRRTLGERARRMVVEEKRWDSMAVRYKQVYEFALAHARQRT